MSADTTKKVALFAILVLIIATAATLSFYEKSSEPDSDTFENALSDDDLQTIKNKASKDADYTVTITVPNGKITLDSKAVSSLNQGGDLTISKTALPSDLPDYVGDIPAYNVSLGDNTDFGEGTATVSIPLDRITGDEATVFYLDSDGKIAGVYYAACEDGYAVFTTSHLSMYAVSSVSTASAIASEIEGISDIFGSFSSVKKVNDSTYTVTASTEFAQAPENTITVYAGSDASRIHDEMSALITGEITAMGVQSTILYTDDIANATVAKIDIAAPVVLTIFYFSVNIGDVTVYAVSDENGAAAYSGLKSVGENADNGVLSEAFAEIISAFESRIGEINLNSAVSMAESFVGSYSGTAFGTFAVASGSDSESASASSSAGSIIWNIDSDGAAKYSSFTDSMDKKVEAGTATKMDYSGCDYASVYIADGKLYVYAFYKGTYIESAITVGSATADNVLEISDFIVRTIGFGFKDAQAFTLLDVVKDFVASSPEFENYGGTWYYDENTGLNNSYIQYVYKSGMSGKAFFQINLTVEEDVNAAYEALRTTINSMLSQSGPMGYKYSETAFNIEGMTSYAITFHGGTMGGVRFVAMVGNILIDGSGTTKGPCADPTVSGEGKDYLYIRGEGEEVQNAQFTKILSALCVSASKFGSEFTVDVGAYAKEFTNFTASKGTWSVAETGDGTATLRLDYTNSSGAARFTTVTAKLSDNASSDYAKLVSDVAALDGTPFLKSTVYSTYNKPVDGVTYTAVAYSGNSMGGLRFAMIVGDIVIDGTGNDSGSDYPYVYIDGGKDTFDSVVAEFLTALNTAFSGGKISGGDTPDEEITGDDEPANVSALRAAQFFTDSVTIGKWTLTGGDEKSAKVTLAYTNKTSDKTVDVNLYRKADNTLYESLAEKILAYDGTSAMGASFVYSTVQFDGGDVSVTAVGSQLTSSYFLRFVMSYGNVVVDASSAGYVYLSGEDCSADVQTLLKEFASALKSAAQASSDYTSGAGYLADQIVKNDTTGMWSHTGIADGTNATLLYTYVTSKGVEKKETVEIYYGSDAATKYAAISKEITDLIGTTTMKATYNDLGITIDGYNVTAIGAQLSTSLFLNFAIQYGDYLIDANTDGYLYILGSDGTADATSLVETFAGAIPTTEPSNALSFAKAFVAANSSYYLTEHADTIAQTIIGKMTYRTWSVNEGADANTAVLTMAYVTSSGKDSSKTFTIYRGQSDITYDILSEKLAAEDTYTALNYTYEGVNITAATRGMGAATMVKFVMSCGNYVIDGYTDNYVYVYNTEDDGATVKAVLDAFASSIADGIDSVQTWTVSGDSTEDNAVLVLTYTTSTGPKTKSFTVVSDSTAANRFDAAVAKISGDSKYNDIGYTASDGVDAKAALRAMGESFLLKFALSYNGITVDASKDSINLGVADNSDAALLVSAFENILKEL